MYHLCLRYRLVMRGSLTTQNNIFLSIIFLKFGSLIKPCYSDHYNRFNFQQKYFGQIFQGMALFHMYFNNTKSHTLHFNANYKTTAWLFYRPTSYTKQSKVKSWKYTKLLYCCFVSILFPHDLKEAFDTFIIKNRRPKYFVANI